VLYLKQIKKISEDFILIKKPYEKYKKWLAKNTESLIGKTVAITGSTGGLGKELSRYLLHLGASLILVDRSYERSMAHKNALTEEFPGADIKLITSDLSDFESVKQAGEALNLERVDFLIHNAGAYSIPRKVCDTGYDNVYQINFVSPYYLTRTLMKSIKERGGRIIIVGSIAHNYSKTDKCDVDFKTRKKASRVYGNAKRFAMFSAFELLSDKDCPAISVCHPGITFTNITSHYPKLIFAIIKHPMKIIFMRRDKAALSILKGVFDSTKKNEWIGPRFFNVWGLPKKMPLKTVTQEESNFIKETSDKIYEQIKS